jgi:hypothetical protein
LPFGFDFFRFVKFLVGHSASVMFAASIWRLLPRHNNHSP